MPEPDSIPFEQPLAELTVHGHEGAPGETFVLRLTPTTLALVPSPETTARIHQGLATGEAELDEAPAVVRWLLARLLHVGLGDIQGAFTPHPLAATAITLAGPYLHVRIGAFDAEYGAGAFDPAAATAFVAHYRAAGGREVDA